MLYQRSYSYRNKTVVLQPRKLQEVYVVPEVILPQKQNRGIIAKKTTGSLCCTRGHTPTETKPWYYSQENYRKSSCTRGYSHRNKTVVLQPRKLQEVYVVPEVILLQKQNRGIIAKKTTELCCTHTPTETKPWYYSYRKSKLYQRSYFHRNKTVVLQPRKLQEVYVVPEVILLQKQNRGIIAKKTTGSLSCTRGHTPTETKPWYYSQENYRKSMLYQRSYSHRNKTVVLQPRKLQEVYVVPEVILLQKQNRGIIARKLQEVYVVPRFCFCGNDLWYILPQKQNRGIIAQENYRKSMLYQRSYSYRNKTVVLQPRKLQEVYVVPEVILPQKQNRGTIAKKTTGSLCCTRGHTPTETKPWYYSQENYRKSMLYQRSYSYRNKTVVLQPRKLQEVYVVPEVILPQKQNRGIIAKKTTGSLCCTRGHTPTEIKPWYYSQENYRKSMLYQRSYSYRNKTVVLQPRKLQEVYVVPEVILPQKQNRGTIAKKTTGSLCCTRGHTPTETKPWYYSQENYRKSMLYQRSYSHRNKNGFVSVGNVVLQPGKLQEVYVVPEVILPQKQNRGIIAKKTTGSLCCTEVILLEEVYTLYRNKTVVLQPTKLQEVYVVVFRGHTPQKFSKPWYYSQENYRKSMLYQRSYSGTDKFSKTVVLQPRKLQEVYVVLILLQKQNRGIIAKKTTGSLSCTRGHTPTETKPWYYSQENYRKFMLYQRSYSYRNKTVVLQPRKLQEVYVVPEVILPQKQNRGIIAKKTTGSLSCTRGHTPTETKPWYYSQENYRKSIVPEVILLQKQNRGIIARKTTGSLAIMYQRSYSYRNQNPWYYSQENYRKSKLYQRSYSHRNKTVVLQPIKLQEVYVVQEVIPYAETKPWYYSQENYRKSMLQQRSYSYRNKTVVLQPRTLQEV